MDKLKAIEASAALLAVQQPTAELRWGLAQVQAWAKEAQGEMVSRGQFAKWCVAALKVREASWTGQGNSYAKTTAQAVAEVVPEAWRTIVACLLTQAYSEVWDWCSEQEIEVS